MYMYIVSKSIYLKPNFLKKGGKIIVNLTVTVRGGEGGVRGK